MVEDTIMVVTIEMVIITTMDTDTIMDTTIIMGIVTIMVIDIELKMVSMDTTIVKIIIENLLTIGVEEITEDTIN